MRQEFQFWEIIPIILIAMFACSSCATIVHGRTDFVSFVSEPHECQVFVNGLLRGKTPLELELE